MEHTILFLGTGAADISPRLETDLRYFFDKTLRRCSSALLDGHILIDCGHHALSCMELAGVRREDITDLFVTHFHDDHFRPDRIQELCDSLPHPLHIWYREDAPTPVFQNAVLHPMKPFTEYEAGGVRLTGLPANHTAHPQHLSIVMPDGKKLFYGPDGAWLLCDTLYYMKEKRYDLMVLDATVGDYVGDFRLGEHNSLPMLRLMLPSMRTFDILTPETKLVLSHIAHTLHRPHEELDALCRREGWIAAYDGMELRF